MTFDGSFSNGRATRLTSFNGISLPWLLGRGFVQMPESVGVLESLSLAEVPWGRALIILSERIGFRLKSRPDCPLSGRLVA